MVNKEGRDSSSPAVVPSFRRLHRHHLPDAAPTVPWPVDSWRGAPMMAMKNLVENLSDNASAAA